MKLAALPDDVLYLCYSYLNTDALVATIHQCICKRLHVIATSYKRFWSPIVLDAIDSKLFPELMSHFALKNYAQQEDTNSTTTTATPQCKNAAVLYYGPFIMEHLALVKIAYNGAQCYSGSGSFPRLAFRSSYNTDALDSIQISNDQKPLTLGDVVSWLGVSVCSKFIPSFDVSESAYPCYHCGNEPNDEIHTDVAHNYVFPSYPEGELGTSLNNNDESKKEFTAIQALQQSSRYDGRIWFVLSHNLSDYEFYQSNKLMVDLYAVGHSKYTNSLIGARTQQYCHNLCD